MKNHGIAAEAKRGQKIIEASDFGRIPSIISSADRVSHAGKTKIGREVLVFEKAMGEWRYRAAMEVRPGRRELALLSFYTIGKTKK